MPECPMRAHCGPGKVCVGGGRDTHGPWELPTLSLPGPAGQVTAGPAGSFQAGPPGQVFHRRTRPRPHRHHSGPCHDRHVHGQDSLCRPNGRRLCQCLCRCGHRRRRRRIGRRVQLCAHRRRRRWRQVAAAHWAAGQAQHISVAAEAAAHWAADPAHRLPSVEAGPAGVGKDNLGGGGAAQATGSGSTGQTGSGNPISQNTGGGGVSGGANVPISTESGKTPTSAATGGGGSGGGGRGGPVESAGRPPADTTGKVSIAPLHGHTAHFSGRVRAHGRPRWVFPCPP